MYTTLTPFILGLTHTYTLSSTSSDITKVSFGSSVVFTLTFKLVVLQRRMYKQTQIYTHMVTLTLLNARGSS